MEVEKINNKSIPLNWGIDSLENIFDIVSGSTPSTENAEFWDGELNWITPNDLNKIKHVYISGSERKITDKGLRNCSAQLIPKNAIVMSSRAPIGYLAIAKQEFTTNQGCKSFILKNTSKHCSEFHFFNLSFNMKKIKDLGTGTTFMEVSKKDLNSVEVSFPKSLNEQLKIADILSTIDKGIEQTEILIAKYKSIKKGLMKDLLTYGIDKDGNIRNLKTHSFVKKNGMVVPAEWEVKRVDELSNVTGGKRLPAGHDYSENRNGYKYLRVTDFYNKNIDYQNLENLEESTFKILDRYEIFNKDLFISIAGSIGYVGVLNSNISDRIILTENALRINIFGDILPEYLTLEINSEVVQKQIWSEIGTGGGVPKLAMHRVKSLLIPHPIITEEFNEQKKIVDLLNAKDNLIKSEETNLAKLYKQKQGLMQDLLTGKIRVKI